MKCCEEGEIERGKGVWVGVREVKRKRKKKEEGGQSSLQDRERKIQ